MGNKHEIPLIQKSYNAHCSSIDIQTSKPYFLIGEDITGNIKVDVTEGFNVESVTIGLLGIETIKIYKKVVEVRLCDVKTTLSKGDGDNGSKFLDVGSHEYPFTISTKNFNDFPSSINCRGKGNSYYCGVNYTLEAVVNSSLNMGYDVKIKKQVPILEEFKVETGKNVRKTGDVKAKGVTYGCFAFEVNLEFTGILSASGFEMQIEYDNKDCSIPLKKIVVKMIENTSLKIDRNSKTFSEDRVVGQWVLPEVPAGEIRFIDSRYSFTASERGVLESVHGKNFKRTYELVVEATYGVSKIENNTNLKISFPVFITSYYKSTGTEKPENKDHEENAL